MKHTLTLSTGVAALSLMTLGAWLAPASAPPAAAPLAGGPTLINQLPYVISQPGVYCVTGPLMAQAAGGGIEIENGVRDVVIDLGGFTLTGVGSADNTHGIWGQEDYVVVKNGTVQNFGLAGLELGDYCRVENVTVRDCGNDGIFVREHSQVIGCIAVNNGGNTGRQIQTLDHSSIVDCDVTGIPDRDAVVLGRYGLAQRVRVDGGKSAFVNFAGGRFEDCSARDFVLIGFELGPDGSMADCYAQGPVELASHGILTEEDCRISDCTVNGGVGVGVETGPNSRIEGTIVSSTTLDGIRAAENTSVESCTVTRCNQVGIASGGGILASRNVQVVGTNSSYNTGSGIRYQAQGGVVRHCVTAENSIDGIRLEEGTLATDNWSASNAAAGLRVAGNRTWLQGNSLDLNDRGLVLEGRDTLVIGNRAVDNASDDYTVPWGNPLGPVNKNSGTIQGSVPQANFKTPF